MNSRVSMLTVSGDTRLELSKAIPTTKDLLRMKSIVKNRYTLFMDEPNGVAIPNIISQVSTCDM